MSTSGKFDPNRQQLPILTKAVRAFILIQIGFLDVGLGWEARGPKQTSHFLIISLVNTALYAWLTYLSIRRQELLDEREELLRKIELEEWERKNGPV